jgi:hypothetical protein
LVVRFDRDPDPLDVKLLEPRGDSLQGKGVDPPPARVGAGERFVDVGVARGR